LNRDSRQVIGQIPVQIHPRIRQIHRGIDPQHLLQPGRKIPIGRPRRTHDKFFRRQIGTPLIRLRQRNHIIGIKQPGYTVIEIRQSRTAVRGSSAQTIRKYMCGGTGQHRTQSAHLPFGIQIPAELREAGRAGRGNFPYRNPQIRQGPFHNIELAVHTIALQEISVRRKQIILGIELKIPIPGKHLRTVRLGQNKHPLPLNRQVRLVAGGFRRSARKIAVHHAHHAAGPHLHGIGPADLPARSRPEIKRLGKLRLKSHPGRLERRRIHIGDIIPDYIHAIFIGLHSG